MYLVILELSLLRIVQYAFSLPTSTADVITATFSPRSPDSSSCHDIYQCRTIVAIIWSCFNTIFLCTWVAMHPDIPASYKSGSWVTFATRARLLAGMLLAPEYFVFDAFYEWREGCALVKDLSNKYGVQWTETHGMMTVMGGIAIMQDGRLLESRLSYDVLDKLMEECEVDFAAVKESDIHDRSKDNEIAKVLVILQIGWFVAQCLARFIRHLPVTLLEVTTLGHTAYVAMIYFFWWNKPLNVQNPMILHAKIRRRSTAQLEGGGISANSEEEEDRLGINRDNRDEIQLLPLVPSAKKRSDPAPELPQRVRLARYIDNLTMRSMGGSIVMLLGIILVLVVSGAFGAIHFIGWNYDTGGIYQLYWQMGTAVVTLAPPLGLAAMAMDQFLGGISTWMFRFLLIPYGGARISLLVVACLSLTSLPPAAFRTPAWTAFIPHL